MPEPLAVSLVARLLAPALAPASRSALGTVSRYLRAESKLPKRETVSELANWIELQIEEAVTDIDKTDLERLREYLSSPDCVTLLEHIFAFRMSGRTLSIDGPLARELQAGLALHDVVLDIASEATVLKVMVAVVRHCVGDDDDAYSPLSAESSAWATTAAIESYLQSIDAQISVLASSAPQFKVSNLRELRYRYTAAVVAADARIQPPSFDGAATVPIEEIYVAPTLEGTDPINGVMQSYRYEDIIRSSHAVVLGNPGGGKTTLGRKIANDLARGYLTVDRGNEHVMPFIVTLREYGGFLERRSGTIVQYVAELLASRYQLQVASEVVEWLMCTGRAYVVFDGLDELLEPSDRQRIAGSITAFSALYASTRILVTSRRVGYLLAPLPNSMFETFTLTGLNQDQIEQYVRNWFQLDRNLTELRREELVAKFIEDSESVNDLRANPLLLGLMCTIYRSESYIPRNRPDVYEKCARMLFDRWDRHRGLLRPVEFESHIDPALMQIAHTIYQSDELQSGISERNLVGEASRYLQEWQYPSSVMADHAARQFVEFCRGRAWVFTDVGLAPDGESLYQFTHRTFLEYFTGAHLARTHESLDSLIETLLPHILNAEWDVVAQLALQIKSKVLQGGPDRVVCALLDRFDSTSDESQRERLLSFTVRGLEFLVVSPAVTSRVGAVIVDDAVERASNEFLTLIAKSANELRELLFCSASARLLTHLDVAKAERRELVCGLGTDLSNHINRLYESRPDRVTPGEITLFNATLDESIRENWREWRWAMVQLLQRDEVALSDAIVVYNSEVLFNPPSTPGCSWSYISPVFHELNSLMWSAVEHEFNESLKALKLYSAVINNCFPFARRNEWETGPFHWLLDEKYYPNDIEKLRDLTLEELRMIGLVVAFILEVAMAEWPRDEAERRIANSRMWGHLGRVTEIASSRFAKSTDNYEHLAHNWGQLLAAWAIGEEDLWQGLPS